jgi:hypothetical protein
MKFIYYLNPKFILKNGRVSGTDWQGVFSNQVVFCYDTQFPQGVKRLFEQPNVSIKYLHNVVFMYAMNDPLISCLWVWYLYYETVCRWENLIVRYSLLKYTKISPAMTIAHC